MKKHKHSKYKYTYYQNTHTYTHPHIKKPTHTHTHTLQNQHIHTHTHTHTHITNPVKTTTAQDTHQMKYNTIKYPQYKVSLKYFCSQEHVAENIANEIHHKY